MKRVSRLGASAAVAVATLAALVVVGPSAGHGKDGKKNENNVGSEKAILFASDGMRPDLM